LSPIRQAFNLKRAGLLAAKKRKERKVRILKQSWPGIFVIRQVCVQLIHFP
jgi:hypothetical protein